MEREDVFEKVYKIAVIVTGDQPSAYEIAKQVSKELAIEGVGEAGDSRAISLVRKLDLHLRVRCSIARNSPLHKEIVKIAKLLAPIGGEKEATESNDKIRPCSNSECTCYNPDEDNGSNCLAYHFDEMKDICKYFIETL